MIQHALRTLPSRPVLYIAPLLILGGLGWFYYSTWRDCTRHAALRAGFMAAAENAVAGRLRFAEVTDFAWDKVAVLAGVEPYGRTNDCPLGWDWSAAERKALAADGRLVVLLFSLRGVIADYIELDADRAAFRDLENPYAPKTAVFKVRRARDGVELRPLSGG